MLASLRRINTSVAAAAARPLMGNLPCAAAAPNFAAAGSSSPTNANVVVSHGVFAPTPTVLYAHWYSGRKRVHRIARDLRFHPKFSVANIGRNRYSRRVHYKTNRWNYREAYKDMP